VSIFERTTITRRPYGAFLDATLPVGIWLSRGEVTGDTSGGTQDIEILFSSTAQLRTQEIFSLEQLSVFLTSGASQVASIRTVNLDPDIPLPGEVNAQQQWSISLVVTGGGAVVLSGADHVGVRGLFLGRQDAPNGNTGLTIQVGNVNGIILAVRAQGYLWGPRSVSTNQGPRRPESGVYLN